MHNLTPDEVDKLFASARAHGVLSFKFGNLQANLDLSQPAHKRGAKDRADKPRDMMDLALEAMSRKASERGEQ